MTTTSTTPLDHCYITSTPSSIPFSSPWPSHPFALQFIKFCRSISDFRSYHTMKYRITLCAIHLILRMSPYSYLAEGNTQNEQQQSIGRGRVLKQKTYKNKMGTICLKYLYRSTQLPKVLKSGFTEKNAAVLLVLR